MIIVGSRLNSPASPPKQLHVLVSYYYSVTHPLLLLSYIFYLSFYFAEYIGD
jgi:hypothetical protein